MKTTVLLMAAGIAGGVLLTPVWAHEGHDHGAQAQRGGEPKAMISRLENPRRRCNSASTSVRFKCMWYRT